LNKPLKTPPPYAIASVDHALRVAVMLQLEDGVTVSEVAERLGVARSTAHRLLAMLVYRDFAVQDENHLYRAGPVLELAAHSQSRVSSLRAAALPHLRRLVDLLDETANLGDGDVTGTPCWRCKRYGQGGERAGPNPAFWGKRSPVETLMLVLQEKIFTFERPRSSWSLVDLIAHLLLPLADIAGRIFSCRTQMAHRVRAAPLARS
jgi:predicted transcriptional regulator